MGIPISQSERLDIFLALSTFYGQKVEEESNSETESTEIDLSFQSLTALGENEFNQLKDRAKGFESLSPDKQKDWQIFWLEKLRHRGQTQRLDESIHVEHIVNVIKDEPTVIQQIIYENLPDNIATELIEIFPEIHQIEGQKKQQIPNEKIATVVRDKFLSNFVAFEDIYKPNAIDELSFEQLENFIWDLGIRETAIACRGIKTKESLAVFLKPFANEVTKEIALKIKDLENIEPKRVIFAESLAKEIFQKEFDSTEWIIRLGSILVTNTYAFRDDVAKQFLKQKFSIEEAGKLDEFIEISESRKFISEQDLIEEILNLASQKKDNVI